MTFKLLFYSAILVWGSSCNKEISELPPPTQTGANTFGCKVDGSFWVPSGFGIIPTASKLEARMLPDHTLIINARNFSRSPTETEFEFVIKNVTATGEYFFNNNVTYPGLSASYTYYVKRKFTPLNEWITTSQVTGRVLITKIETGAGAFASGIFEFDAISMYNSSQVIHITDGRFDVRLP